MDPDPLDLGSDVRGVARGLPGTSLQAWVPPVRKYSDSLGLDALYALLPGRSSPGAPRWEQFPVYSVAPISTPSSAGGTRKPASGRARCRSLGAESAADAATLVPVETENQTVTLEPRERVQVRSIVDTPAAMAREAAVRVRVGLPAEI